MSKDSFSDEFVYGVFDSKMQSFRFKFFCATDKAAEREFGDAVNNPKSVFSQHPEDFLLYRLGSFDTVSGLLQPESPIILLGRADEYVQVKKQEVSS